MRAEWDFEKLPASEHGRVLEALQQGRLWELAAIHDQYGLSDYSYCCSNTLRGLKTWFEYGVKTGKITAPVDTERSSSESEPASEI